MHFATPEPSALSSNLNITKVIFACGFATTDVESIQSILTCSSQDVKDTSAW
jgi:hypothetical protein